jgi:hypothetical protein
LIEANVLGTELIGRFAEVLGEHGDGVQVKSNGCFGVMADLEILQHPLSKSGHNEGSFRFDHTTKNGLTEGAIGKSTSRHVLQPPFCRPAA